MPTLHDLIPAALARLANATPETTAQRKADARAARASAGRRRLDGRLLAGSLACALAAAAAYPTTSTYNPWYEDAVATPGEFRFAPGEETRWAYNLPTPDDWCGRELPGTMLSGDGFTLNANPGASAEGPPRWSVAIDYAGPDREIFVDDNVGLIARDGIVVGIQYNYEGWSPDSVLTYDQSTRVVGSSQGGFDQMSWCATFDGATGVDAVVAQAGEYEMAWVVPVHMSRRDAAIAALRSGGYGIAGATRDLPAWYPDEYRYTFTWAPGSVDCIKALITSGYGDESPLQCHRTLPDFVTQEPGTGAYTVRFDEDQRLPPVNVQLVSERVRFTLDHDVTFADLGYVTPGPAEEPAVPSCETPSWNFRWTNDGVQGLQTSETMPDALAGTPVAMEVDYQPTGGETRATVSLPEGARVWIAPPDDGVGDMNPTFSAYGTVHFSSPTVELHREAGFAVVEVWVTDIARCDNTPADADFMGRADTWLYVASPVEIAWESGRVQTVQEMSIVPDPYWW